VKWAIHGVLKSAGLIIKDVDYYDPPWRYLLAPALVGTVLVIPFFFLAVIGGRLFRRAGIVLMRQAPRGTVGAACSGWLATNGRSRSQ